MDKAAQGTRCAIYCRLSREDEDKLRESESIQNQKAILTAYAKEQQWEISHIYCDEDYSGADRSRPDFNRMLQDAKKHRFELILCKTQSRFTRDMELVERYIHGLFPLWGIRFVAIADHVDTALQGNKKARQINGLVNEWYLEDLSENIRMVLNHKRQQGQYIGGFPLYGYQKHPTEKGRLVIDPEAADIVRYIFRLALEGDGKQQIANQLNQMGLPNPSRYKREHGSGYRSGIATDPRGLWSRSSVGRILHNEMYLGIMVQGTHRKLSFKSHKLVDVPREAWFRVEGTHEAIIDPNTFACVQALHKLRSKSDGSGAPHPLAGLVTCLSCGSRMQKSAYQYQGKHYRYLRCPSNGTKNGSAPGCACSIRLEDLLLLLEEQVKKYISQWYSTDPLARIAQKKRNYLEKISVQKEQSDLTPRLSTYLSALESLYLDKASGLVTPQQFQELSAALSSKIDSLRLRISVLAENQSQGSFSSPCDTSLQLSLDALTSNSIPRALMVQLIESIGIGRKDPSTGRQQIELVWKF